MTETVETPFEKQARENLKISPKKMETFLRQARALRRNLKIRQEQERQKKWKRSK